METPTMTIRALLLAGVTLAASAGWAMNLRPVMSDMVDDRRPQTTEIASPFKAEYALPPGTDDLVRPAGTSAWLARAYLKPWPLPRE
jgi:hypothetical protein